MKTRLLIMAMAVITLFSCNNGSEKNADKSAQVDSTKTIYFGGDIITMEGDEPEYAEAVVRENDKIVFVGKKDEALKQYPNAVQYDLQGKTMLPSFIDPHSHIYGVGLQAVSANLLPPPDGEANTVDKMVDILKQYENSENGKIVIDKVGWIIGFGYDDAELDRYPTAADLDKVSKDKPVIIIHASFHFCVVNTKGLEAFGITADTKNPHGGVIRRIKGTQQPNGVLEELAFFGGFFPLMQTFPEDLEDYMFQKAQEMYASYGYSTAVEGRSTKAITKFLFRAADNKKMFLDVLTFADISDNREAMYTKYYRPNYVNNFRIAGPKLVHDGSPQGKTAWLTQPYLVPPNGQKKGYKGFPIHEDEEAYALIDTCYKNGWNFQIHCNGDAAIDQLLKGVELAVAKYGKKGLKPVLVHGQTLRADQIPLLVKYDIFPSLFPMHTFYWGDWHVSSVLGHPRADFISPTKAVLDAGLKFTSHHDAPVATPSVFRVLDATVNRITRSGVVLGPDQRVSPYIALKSNTIWSAIQHFEDNLKGTLTVGKYADFVILDRNPLKIDPLTIKDLYVIENIKRGVSIYKK